jgi:hypothetical protein
MGIKSLPVIIKKPGIRKMVGSVAVDMVQLQHMTKSAAIAYISMLPDNIVLAYEHQEPERISKQDLVQRFQ